MCCMDSSTNNHDGHYNWWGIEDVVTSCISVSARKKVSSEPKVESITTIITTKDAHIDQKSNKEVHSQIGRHNWWSSEDE